MKTGRSDRPAQRDVVGEGARDPATATAQAAAAAAALPEPSRHGVRQFVREHRRLLGLLLAAAVITGFVIGVLPQITGLGSTLRRLGHGDLTWLLIGVGLECVSLAGYVLLFRTVLSDDGTRIGWKASYDITLAGVVATKLFAAAGAGGIALTAWALTAAGLSGRAIARRMAGFEILLYGVFMLTLVIVGVLLGTHVLGTHVPSEVSYVPAAIGAIIIAVALAMLRVSPQLEHSAAHMHRGPRWVSRLLARLASVPATIRDGMATAATLIKAAKLGLLGAVVYWAFDIATLWASFRAFGAAPSVPVVIMGYFVGQLFNAVPLPGGIGGVEGGMIGCFVLLHVNVGAALVGVFAYRAISFWLPTLPGLIAYLSLRRRVAAWRQSTGAGAVSSG